MRPNAPYLFIFFDKRQTILLVNGEALALNGSTWLTVAVKLFVKILNQPTNH